MGQFVLPDLGEGLEEAQLVQWLVRVGDAVALNQPLCQVETAKALIDIPSPYAGTVRALHAAPGETVPVGAPLITIAEPAAPATDSGMAESHGPVLVGYGAEAPAQAFTRRRRLAPGGTAPAPAAAALVTEPLATPLVRKLAQEQGIDLRALRGTGPGGRIRVEDLASARRTPASPVVASPVAAGPVAPAAAADDEERISTVGLRKAIAAKMVQAATTIPHFTEYGLFDATALVALRERLRAAPAFAALRLTYLPFFARALALAVRAYPIMNSRWDERGNAIVIKRSLHLGIATDTERGLLVPVIHDAQALDLAGLAAACERLVVGARAGTLGARDMTGGTITITNVGAAGPVETGAPLINPPEVCVVGFGAIKPRPTVIGDAVRVRPGAWISLSCDHRVVDGAAAARFLAALAQALEAPERLTAT